MMDKKRISLIKKILRRGSLQNPARNEAKSKAKIAAALFKCQCGCNTAIYEGSSDDNYRWLKAEFPDLWILKGKGAIDHINPVREGKRDEPIDWNNYIESLFCEVDNLQYLSPACHDNKSLMDRENGKAK